MPHGGAKLVLNKVLRAPGDPTLGLFAPQTRASPGSVKHKWPFIRTATFFFIRCREDDVTHVPSLRVSFRRVSLLSAREEHPLVAARAIMKLKPQTLWTSKKLFVFWRDQSSLRVSPLDRLRAVAASATIENRPAGSIVIDEDARVITSISASRERWTFIAKRST